MFSIVFYIHLLVTILTTGMIWYMQVVHLPLLRFGTGEDQKGFARLYKDRLTLFTFPLMSLEFITGVVVLLRFSFVPMETAQARTSFTIYGIALVVLMINLLITFQLIRPLINRFFKDFSAESARKVEAWNWVRTAGWTIRFILILIIIFSR